jgi:predicted transcriptional regulator
MDNLNAVLMYLKGTSPQEAAARWEKRMEEEEEIARKASQNKVMEWMKGVEVGGL